MTPSSKTVGSRAFAALGLALLLIACKDDGSKAMAEAAKKHPVEPAKLAALIQQADKIVVFDSPYKDGTVIYTSTAPQDIAEFNDALTIVPPKGWFHCMCGGAPAIRLYRGDTEIALITNHHGRSIRYKEWTSDAMLRDPEKWLQWFDARAMPKPRQEVDAQAARDKRGALSYARWLEAMPMSIRPLWQEAIRDEVYPNIKPLRKALAKEFPDTRQRILALLNWFGSGDGPWSGFPGYEMAAEKLLVELPYRDLIATAQDPSLTDTQVEGAARLFTTWTFVYDLPKGLDTVPPDLKKKLLDHSLKSTDADKRARAQHAFAQ